MGPQKGTAINRNKAEHSAERGEIRLQLILLLGAKPNTNAEFL